MLKFGKAYYYRPGPSRLLLGSRVNMRPEAQIYAFGHLLPGRTVMDRLDEIKTPTLVLAGRDDLQFPPEHQEELDAGIPNARLHIIDRAGHNAPQELLKHVCQPLATTETPANDAYFDRLKGDSWSP